MEGTEKILPKIKKLLALSQSPNEAEATAAAEKAHGLLRDYNLSMTDIEGCGEEKEVRGSVVHSGTRQTTWKRNLLNRVATFNYCAMVYWGNSLGYSWKLFGREANVQASMAMWEYLTETVERMGKKAALKRGVSAASYCDGAVIRLGERLWLLKQAEMQECTALVPLANEAMAALESEHKNLRKTTERHESNKSAAMGYSDAEHISLSAQIGA